MEGGGAGMKFSYEKTIDIGSQRQRLLVDAANGVAIYRDDDGVPGGLYALIEAGLMKEVPDPCGTIRPHYGLSNAGLKFVSDNFHKKVLFEVTV